MRYRAGHNGPAKVLRALDTEPMTFIKLASYPVRIGVLATVYFIAAKLSLLLAIPPGYATAVWPPSGIALAAVLLYGDRIWPGIWIGAALVNFTVNSSLLAAIFIGSGNTLEALGCAALIQRYVGVPYRFYSGEDVVKFVAVAALGATIAATIGVMSLTLAGVVPWVRFLENWWTWWEGDTAGIIIVSPLLLSWAVRGATAGALHTKTELSCFGLLLIIVGYVVFNNGDTYVASLPLTFVILPLIIWAAFRFDQREVVTASAIVCAMAVWYTLEGRGPFAFGSVNLSLLLLLAFISTVVATGLILSAVVAERRRVADELRTALQDLQEQAISDPLTGLYNRRFLREFLPREVMRAARNEASLAVIMIDLDHFKRINDNFGHGAGDRVLTEVAVLLKSCIRGSDIACRFGGEEFMLVLPEATLESAQRKCNDIRAAMRRLTLKYDGRQLGILTASFGVALFPDHADDPESLMHVADEALYEAKGAGRDRVVIGAAHGSSPKSPNKSKLLQK